MKRKSEAWANQAGFRWQVPCDEPEAVLTRCGWPFGFTSGDLGDFDDRVEDAVMVCRLVELIEAEHECLDAGFLLSSVGPDPSHFVGRIHERHAVSWNRPAHRRGTMEGISACVGAAIDDCQVALGVSVIPPNTGAYWILREPCFARALFEGRALEEIVAIVAMNELRKGARNVSWLRKEPGATEPAEDRDFWLGWPGNDARLLKACRDLVSRRVGWRGGIEASGQPGRAHDPLQGG